MKKLKVLIVAAEATPLAVMGELSQITGLLAYYLNKLDLEVRVILPFYKVTANNNNYKFNTIGNISLPFKPDSNNRKKNLESKIIETVHNGIKFYFIDQPELYMRDGIYQYKTADGNYLDFEDNLLRFSYFSKAVLESISETKFYPDIIHCFSWHTALVPIYLKTLYSDNTKYSKIKSLFTMPSMAFQGLFPKNEYDITGLPTELFSSNYLEYYGMFNLLKGGIIFSDHINTISKKYAEEIQTGKFGCGLEGVIQKRRNNLTGILNGIDYNRWNPETDKYLYGINYNISSLQKKNEIKKNLLKEFSLDYKKKNRPLFIFLSRLETQKGLGLLEEIKDNLLQEDISLIIMSSGSQRYTNLLNRISEKYPDRVSFKNINDNEELLHKIIAGGDILLKPSEYEPSGQNQQIALRYGTIPLVHSTGGLSDSIIEEYNGFIFRNYNAVEFLSCIHKALRFYHDKTKWKKLQKYGMEQDWSWAHSAKKYHAIYKNIHVQD